ncbi:hypothetical protein ASC59_16660 [Leifsonia sp. Root1293]|nr:hypothetical protein ASC59_16660 [Leifsonia sp. Root1293]KRA09335.1 hypothetical protein ASD61_16655 [Leifsonia sp. Root60]
MAIASTVPAPRSSPSAHALVAGVAGVAGVTGVTGGACVTCVVIPSLSVGPAIGVTAHRPARTTEQTP